MASITPKPTTELEAVNAMLRGIGESPVSTLSGSSVNVDVASARKLLLEISKEVQEEGWHFNTQEEYALSANQDGEFVLPANTCKVDATNRGRNVTFRAGKLYDLENHTYTFTETSMDVDIVFYLPFDELPAVVRTYIKIRAVRQFQDTHQGDDQLHIYNERDEIRARARMMAEEGDSADHNIFDEPNLAFTTRRHSPRRYNF